MEYWVMGKWENGLPVESLKVVRLVKCILIKKFKIFINEKLPLKTNLPIFHHSIIPFVRQKKHASINHFNSPALIEIHRRLSRGRCLHRPDGRPVRGTGPTIPVNRIFKVFYIFLVNKYNTSV